MKWQALPQASADAASGADHEFLGAVLAGLGAPRKSLPCKFLYDRTGSRLFDAITRLPEYYPTRTEEALLRSARREIAELIGANAELIELGAGSLRKVRILLSALRSTAAFVPVDVSREHLTAAAAALCREFPNLAVRPVIADFSRDLGLPPAVAGVPRVVFFPGSTIGNFSPAEARRLLAAIAHAVGTAGGLLIGVDLVKDPAVLHAAYNDAAGVTAAFNRNILVRANRELGANFVPDSFRHFAPYDSVHGRVEMHLVSGAAQRVQVAGRDFRFRTGETIHTESSYKYTVPQFLELAASVHFTAVRTWTDPAQLFSVHYLNVR